MPVFISYSHQDRDFVDSLAHQLVAHKVSLWLDRWEMHVGDSIINRIQEAITSASALLIVLSKNSVDSQWVNKELNAGYIRELEENRVFVLPVKIDDCELPIFLRDKYYADMRKNPDDAFTDILEAIARVNNEWQGRVDDPDWHMDWAVDYGHFEDYPSARLTIVEQAKGQPYCVLSTISVVDQRSQSIDEEHARELILEANENISQKGQMSVRLEDQFEKFRRFSFRKDKSLKIIMSVRRLGEDTGRDIIFHADQQLDQISKAIKGVLAGRRA